MYYFLLSIQLLLAIAIVVMVLLQPHEGEGMGAVFGGSSSVETFLGTKTITVLWKATVVCGCLFIGLAILLNIISTGSSSNSGAFDNQPASEQSVPAGSGTDDSSGESGGSVPSGDGTESGSDANQQ